MHDNLAIFLRGKLADSLCQLTEGDKRRANVDDLNLVRLAHVEDEYIFVCVEAALQLLHTDLRNAVYNGNAGHCLILRDFEWPDAGRLLDAAELVVVDERGDAGMRAADRTVGILVQLQRAELHGERVDEQEATGEALADTQDQLCLLY